MFDFICITLYVTACVLK